MHKGVCASKKWVLASPLTAIAYNASGIFQNILISETLNYSSLHLQGSQTDMNQSVALSLVSILVVQLGARPFLLTWSFSGTI